MKKILKLFLPILFSGMYVISAGIIYYGVTDDVFSIKDSCQMVVGNLILIALLYLYAKFICKRDWKNIKNTSLNFKKGILIFMMVPGIQFLIYRIVIRIMTYVGYEAMPFVGDVGEIKVFVFDAFFAIIIAPVVEEMIFRLCLISSYHSKAGKMYGMIAGAVIFGWMHSTIPARVGAVFLGLFLGIAMLVTDDVLVCILIHASVNFIVTICGCVIAATRNEEIIAVVLSLVYVNTPILLCSILVSVIGAILLYKNKRCCVMED